MSQNSISATFPADKHELITAGTGIDLTGRNIKCLVVVGGGVIQLSDANGTPLTYEYPAGVMPFIPSSIGAGTAVDIVIWS